MSQFPVTGQSPYGDTLKDYIDDADASVATMAEQASDDVVAHTAAASGAHPSTAISHGSAGNVSDALDSATSAASTASSQAAAAAGQASTVAGALTAHITDTTDAHAASAISYAGGPSLSASTVGAAIDSLDARTAGGGGGGLTGTGFPGTGSNAAATDAAPVGSTYTDTDVTAGALHWTKYAAGTGTSAWRVTYGDTGPRTILASDMLNGWTNNSSLLTIQRVNNLVILTSLNALNGAAATASTWLDPVPAGWRPFATAGNLPLGGFLRAGTNTPSVLTAGYASGRLFMQATVAQIHGGVAIWRTPEQWPASLPYAPA